MKILVCDCSSTEHQIVVSYDADDNVAYCHIHLAKRNFFRRVILGLRYIFGYHCKYGHWEEFVWGKKHIKPLKKLISKIEKGEN